MVLEELDGFIAGLLVCPETIPVSEWFAAAFGMTGGRTSVFDTIDHANDILGRVTDYYNDIAMTLAEHPEEYRPLFPIDESNGDVLWELWIDGFMRAIDLRRSAWTKLLDVGEDATAALAGLFMLADIAGENHDLPDKELTRLTQQAPMLIPQWVITLHAHRLSRPAPVSSLADQPNPFATARKVGRNEPCPCGSGKKYKRCCGAN
ncbi:putative transporter (YecA family protein with SEC-C motif) [Bradyrhizobium sp. STM 3843]|nr:putative transporter (YecA family protein with SEC-C motif) [Bradyrhizobium sp. STM 3843]